MAYDRKRKRVRRRVVGKRKFVRKSSKPASSQVFNRRVKQVVSRLAEKKTVSYEINAVSPLVLRTGSASAAANVFSMTPYQGYYTISQGTGQGARIGNKIRVTKAILNVSMVPNPYNASTNPLPTPMFVRVWFVTSKVTPTVPVPSSQIYGGSASFLQNGNSFTGLSGTFQDLQLLANRDSLIYRGHRTFKVGSAAYDPATGSQAGYGNMANNDFKLCVLKKINITNMFPTIIQFDDTVQDPTSYNVTMVVQPVFCTGIAPGATITPLSFKFGLTVMYTDI